MTAWIAGRSTPLVQAACAAGLLLASAAVAHRADDPAEVFAVMAVAVAGAAVLIVAPQIEPAVPITAAIVLSVFSGNWKLLGIPLGLDRPLIMLGLAAVALRALPDARRRELPIVRPVHLLLAAISVYAIISAAVTGTLTSREPLFALLDKFGILAFALFFVAPLVYKGERERNMLIAGLTALGGYLGLTAAFESFGPKALVFPHFIADRSVGLHYGRARGPFLEAAANGLALYICAVAACIGIVVYRRKGVRVLCGLVVILCALGMMLTLTRQIWVGATVATLVAMLSTAHLRRWIVPTIVAVAVIVGGAFALAPGVKERASARANAERPVWDRLNSNRAAVDMVVDRPLVGFGWYSWASESHDYYTQAESYPVTVVGRAHNVVLSNAVELGLPATLAWLAALALAVGGAVLMRAPPELEPWRVGLIAVFLNWLVISNFTPLAYSFPNYLVWLWAGVVMAGAWRPHAFARRTWARRYLRPAT